MKYIVIILITWMLLTLSGYRHRNRRLRDHSVQCSNTNIMFQGNLATQERISSLKARDGMVRGHWSVLSPQ